MRRITVKIALCLALITLLVTGCKDLLHPEGSQLRTVTFSINGGSGTAPKAQTAKIDSSITLPGGSGLSHNGYTFGGWNTRADGAGTAYSAGVSYTVTEDVTLYAKWNTITYTVTFNSNSGSSVASQTVNSGGTATRPTNPTRTGYTFDNWYSNSGLTTVYNFSTPVTGDITLYAKWNTTRTFTVTFNSNEGSSVATQTVNGGSTATRPTNPTRSGYTFDNWYNSSGLTTVYDFSTPVTRNITLYAKWNTTGATTYTVTFNSNSGSSVAAQTVSSGGRATRPTNPTRSGYTFDNWYSNSGLTTVYNFSAAVTGNITLYAKWSTSTPTTYTVTFNSNSGSSVASQTVNSGGTATRPTNPTRTGYTFDNWYSNSGLTTVYNFSTPVTGNVSLYAKWYATTIVSGANLAAKLTWLESNAQSNTDYTIEVNANESIEPQELSYGSENNIRITLKGTGAVRTINLSSDGSMFTVESGVTLILDNNITLQGRDDNTARLVHAHDEGILIMNTGSKITGNTGDDGGGVYVNNGNFIMNGGEISGNTASQGGGVYATNGNFIMNSGNISGNTADESGGGVVLDSSTFIMNGGNISGNTVVISESGGVHLINGGDFTMNGGTISGNTAPLGGGVSMSNYGGGGDFTMNGGIISSNTATAFGGGVCVFKGTFTKTGGTITGYASDTANGNVVKNESGVVQSNLGHAVYVGNFNKRKETTAGPTVNLSYDGSDYSFSGGWDY